MPWNSDQLPWSNFKYPNPPRPEGIFEPLNWMKGPPIMIGGGGPLGHIGGVSPLHGTGLKPYFPNRTTLQYQYNPPIIGGIGRSITAQRLT